ncbi:MAG TPA: stage II sporulation protein E [Mobilitalea sp.]|nr:stage II sporulation protein E [Mobilitalea sp.]
MGIIRKRSILIYLIGFVVARAVLFQMDPLAIGFFTAAYLERAGGGILFFVILAGIGSALPATALLKYILTLITAVIILESPIIKRRTISKSVLYALPPIMLGVFSMVEAAAAGWDADYVALAVLETVLAYVSAIIFNHGIDFLLHEAKGYRINNEQMVSLAFTVAVFIYAVPEAGNLSVAPVETAVYFILLFFTYKYGVGQGTVAGAVSGLALSLRGGPASGIGILTMMGIIPAAFRELGRIATASVFIITAFISGTIYEDMALQMREIGALVSAVILFLLLPSSLIYRIDTDKYSGGRDSLATQNLKKIADSRMKIFSESFLKLSKTLKAITNRQSMIKQQEINFIFEEISERLCKNCSNCSNCWDHNLQAMNQAANRMFEAAETNGYIRRDDVPDYFKDSCICADQFLMETNKGFEIAKLNHIWTNRMSESREVIAEQLKEVSLCIQNMTGDIYGLAQAMRKEEELVSRRLRSERISVRNIAIIERADKRKEIYLCAAAARGQCITARDVSTFIGEALGVKTRVSDASKTVMSREYDNFVFLEDTKFKVLTGVARAMKDNVSGDNFSTRKLDTGEYLLALSDGMGTGKEAGEESETVLALLEQLIDAGFKTETAIKLINSSLVLKAEDLTFSTVDIGIINLFTGMCEFTKIGAATAFIKRDNWVETISSTTLPIGMLGNVDSDTVTKKLYEGDIVILVTDGVLDSILEENKEAYMEQLIMDISSSNPQEIANRILNNTLAQTNYVPIDDMTVITAGIWLK